MSFWRDPTSFTSWACSSASCPDRAARNSGTRLPFGSPVMNEARSPLCAFNSAASFGMLADFDCFRPVSMTEVDTLRLLRTLPTL